MCNPTLGDFLPLTITISNEGLPSIKELREDLIRARSSAAGLTENAWRQVSEALAGVTQVPELLSPGSKIVLERGTACSEWQGEMPWALRPLGVRVVPAARMIPGGAT